MEGKSRAVPDPEPDELVAEKAFDKLYQKLEANGEFEGELPSALWSSSKLSSSSVMGSILIDIYMSSASYVVVEDKNFDYVATFNITTVYKLTLYPFPSN